MQPKPKANKKHQPTRPGKGSDSSLKERSEMIAEVEKASAKGKVKDYDGNVDVDDEQEYAKGGQVKGLKKGGPKGGHKGYNKGGMKGC